MARKGPRTAPCGAADARSRIRRAEEFLAQAQRALSQPASPDAAAALAVLAGIAASDAACCAQLGMRSRGQDHRQAREVLSKVQPNGMQMAQLLEELLSAKDASHYGTILIEHQRAVRLVRQAEHLVRSARRSMSHGPLYTDVSRFLRRCGSSRLGAVNTVPAQEARRRTLDRLRTEQFDLLVVGGGITGAGVALDAAARGLRVALVERADFASGTSSKSSKLIHGGLRYLQQGDIALVYEALYERQRLLRNAPHLVRTLPFMIPVMTRDGVVSRKIARALGSALWMYDLTGGWRVGKLHRRLRAKTALAHMPTMNADKLSSAYLYFDAEADDARLTLAIIRSAAERGAAIANYCGVTALKKDSSGATVGASVTTHEGDSFDIAARAVVNATGVWGDSMRRMDVGGDSTTIRPAKGIHITVPWELVRNDIAVVIPVPGDKRSLFVVPHMPNGDGTYRYTYVGTTDTDYRGSIDDPQCTQEDIDYCLRALNKAVAGGGRAITRDDVIGTWAGLRPLVALQDGEKQSGRTADLSRRHKVIVSDSGMVTITGGKLTTYRKMAEHTVDAVLGVLQTQGHVTRAKRCTTKRMDLFAATTRDREDHLVSRFGTEATVVRNMIASDASLGEPLVNGLPYLRAEAVYSARHELVVTLDDLLSRRTRGLLYDRHATAAAATDVAKLVASELGWDDARVQDEVKRFLDVCAREDEAAVS